MFVAKVVHCRIELMLEMTYVHGEHLFSLVYFSHHCWNYDLIGGVHGVLHVIL